MLKEGRNPLEAGQKFNKPSLRKKREFFSRNPLEAGQKFNEKAREQVRSAERSQSP